MNYSVHLEDIACPLGCPKSDKVVLTGRDRFHDLPGEFSVVKCCTCGLMRTNPRPTPETMGFYYPDNYGPYLGTRVQQAASKRHSGFKKLLKPFVRWFFKFNTNILPDLPSGRMLEVGCASGAFLHQMSEQGWEVEGIEFSVKAASAASQLGFNIHAGPLETAPAPRKLFDLIVGWMVLEHLHDPIGGLRKLHEWSKPGSWLVLSVPNSGAFEFHLFKERLYALHLPNHLYHFTPETLGRVLQAGGWTMKRVYQQRVLNNLVGSIGHFLRGKGFANLGQKFIDFPERNGRWAYVCYPLAWILSLFGQTGRMTVWATRQNN